MWLFSLEICYSYFDAPSSVIRLGNIASQKNKRNKIRSYQKKDSRKKFRTVQGYSNQEVDDKT